MKYRFLHTSLVICALCTVQSVIAQPGCPCMTISQDVGCVPFDAKVTDCTSGQVSSILYSFGDGSPLKSSTQHTYTLPGTYKVIQYGNFTCGGTAGLDSIVKSVKVLPVPAPKLTFFPCAQKKLSVRASDPQYPRYSIDFKNGDIQTVMQNQFAVSTYQNILPTDVSVKGLYPENCGGKKDTTVELFDQLVKPVVTEVKVVRRGITDGQINVQLQSVKYHRYALSVRTGTQGTFQTVDTLYFSTSGTYTWPVYGLNTRDTNYCLKITAFDWCGAAPIESEVYCSIHLNASAQNQKIDIDWTFAPEQFTGILYRNESQLISVNGSGTGSYTDTAISCARRYCYTFVADAAYKSVSDTVCQSAFSIETPEPVTVLKSGFNQSDVQVDWKRPVNVAVKDYSVFRSVGGTYEPIGTTAREYWRESSPTPLRNVCYKVQYTDSCGNVSPQSLPVCPIILTGTGQNFVYELKWAAYVGAGLIPEYRIEKLTGDGGVYTSYDVDNLLEYKNRMPDTVHQKLQYRIRAKLSQDSVWGIVYSNTLEFEQKSTLHAPNAFTPNGDGLNDLFRLEGLFVKEYKLEIYNRIGETMYAGTDFLTGWNGEVQGRPADQGVYFYKAQATDFAGKTIVKSGNLQLIR